MAEKEDNVFYPTYEELSDLPGYIQHIEDTYSAHEFGVIKIIPPEGWNPRPGGYNEEEINNILIERPLEQSIFGTNGYYQISATPLTAMTVGELRAKSIPTPTNKDGTPISHEDLEGRFWRDINTNRSTKPIYEVDVPLTMIDESVQVW